MREYLKGGTCKKIFLDDQVVLSDDTKDVHETAVINPSKKKNYCLLLFHFQSCIYYCCSL